MPITLVFCFCGFSSRVLIAFLFALPLFHLPSFAGSTLADEIRASVTGPDEFAIDQPGWGGAVEFNATPGAEASASPKDEDRVHEAIDGVFADAIGSRWFVPQWRANDAWLQLRLAVPQRIAGARIHSGYDTSSAEIIGDFKLQHHSNGAWIDVPGARILDNIAGVREVRFDAEVVADLFRLVSLTNRAFRIKEIELLARWSENDRVVSVADHGASPSKSPDENNAAFFRAIEAARLARATKLVVPTGTYRFQCRPGIAVLQFTGLKDFVFDGGGSTFVFLDSPTSGTLQSLVRVEDCERVKFTNYTMDWDWAASPLSAIGRIESRDADGLGLVFRLQSGQTVPPGVTSSGGREWDPSILNRSPAGFPCPRPQSTEVLAPDRLRLRFTDASAIAAAEIGMHTKLVLDTRVRPSGHVLQSNEHLTLDGVTVRSAPGGAVYAWNNIHYQIARCVVAPPEGSERMRSVHSGFEIHACRGFFRLEDNVVRHHDDDGLHYSNSFLGSGFIVTGPNTLIADRLQAYPNVDLVKDGLRMALYSAHFAPLGWSSEIVSHQWQMDYHVGERAPHRCEITFAQPLPAQVPGGAILINDGFTNGHYVIRGNRFFHGLTHGMTISMPNGLIEGNLVEGSAYPGIMVHMLSRWSRWHMGPHPENVIIRQNTLGRNNSALREPSSLFVGGGRDNSRGNLGERGYKHVEHAVSRRILIEDNHIFDATWAPLAVWSAKDVLISGNTFVNHNLSESSVHYAGRGSLFVHDAERIAITGNTSMRAQPAHATGIHVDTATVSDFHVSGNQGFDAPISDNPAYPNTDLHSKHYLVSNEHRLGGWWIFDHQNTQDRTPYRNHGALTGGSFTTDAVGGPRALQLAANGDRIDLGVSLVLKSTAFTLTGFIKLPDLPAPNEGILWDNLAATAGVRVFIDAEGRLGLRSRGPGGEAQIVSTRSLSPGYWHHYTVTSDGTQARILLDGHEAGSGSITGRIAASGFTVRTFVGNTSAGGASTQLKATLDEMMFWNGALTPAQSHIASGIFLGETSASPWRTGFRENEYEVNDDANFHWDEAAKRLDLDLPNTSDAPARYAYQLTDRRGNSFTLRYEVKLDYQGWEAPLRVGLKQNASANWGADRGISCTFVLRSTGYSIELYARDGSGAAAFRRDWPDGWQFDEPPRWVTVQFYYDAPAERLTLSLYEAETGQELLEHTFTNVKPFPADMDKFVISARGDDYTKSGFLDSTLASLRKPLLVPYRLPAIEPVRRGWQDWAATHLSGVSGEEGGPAGDLGGRGIPNLLRYAFGLDALAPDRTRLPSLAIVVPGGETEKYLSLTWTRRIDDAQLNFRVEASDDLVNWQPVENPQILEHQQGAETETLNIRDAQPLPSGGGTRFLRVRVEVSGE